MKSPFTGGNVRLEKESRTFDYRKEKFEIIYHYYVCEESGEQFTNDELDTLNITQVHNKYRSRFGIPTIEEIKHARSKYGLSAAKMSEILGLGINVYRNYEAGEMPSISIGRYIRLVADPQEFIKLVEINKSSWDATEYSEVLEIISKFRDPQLYEDEGQLALSLFKDCLPNIYNGFRVPGIKRIGAMINYFATALQPFTTALNKLMFYADFSHYKKHGMSISGITYKAIQRGPVPTNYGGLYNAAVNKGYVKVAEVDFGEYGGDKFYNDEETTPVNLLDALTQLELATLETITEKFRNMNTSQIVDVSHNEPGWKENVNNFDKISYDFSFSLNI
ncbi:type II toxin-antitoxin system antitoxin SocA domain-containing protein [Chitinophaga sp. HK235]|uniref:type II toxin-antitoxin system antitoxin SocA domain-containing protein n=1 Tax=Chitinophaga sp. HK235 TaxID=2952571 RepID=UPI001BADEF92|nr:type II toxin-antitoxin system antitoxin SocA domain-containing protein [Chitinophaga sp. HK235]